MKIANSQHKVMTAAEAVDNFVFDGAVVGMGGQTIGRNTMAIAHEIVRQRKRDLVLVGCSMGMSMDILVGAGAVKRTECGTGNLERLGTAFRWRRAIEEGKLQTLDYSHLSMALRFLAGSMGLPFMPTKSMLGTDIINKRSPGEEKPFAITDNPWNPDDPVLLLPALQPDVSLIHAQEADEMGNLVIQGFTTHEPEMVKASKSVIVSCERLISSDMTRRSPERTTVPYIYVDAVVEQPWGAYPTSTYRHYEHDTAYIRSYQEIARSEGKGYEGYLRETIFSHDTFDDYLDRKIGKPRLQELADSMTSVI